MSSVLLLMISSFLFMLTTAFFTMSETALISSDKTFLGKKKKVGNLRASNALRLLENLDFLLATTQFGANLSIAAATTLATLAIRKMGGGHDFLLLLIFAPLTLVLSDSLPKVIGRTFPEKISLLVALPLLAFSRIFYPILAGISFYTDRISRLAGLGKADSLSRRKRVREELQSIISDADNESEVRLGHKRMIRRLLDFPQQSVKRVMLPFVNVDAVEKDATIQEAIALFETLRHSRLPVYDERIDNIVGVLHFYDVFQCKNPEETTVAKFMRQPLFVPEVQQLETLTKEMQQAEVAIVVDEYGGAVGIVTKEDVLEEIVGDISDEWDEHRLGIMEISASSYLVQVNTAIPDLNEKLKIHVPQGEYETLSGFLLQQFNRIPSVGDELYFANFKVRVHRASPKSIETVIIEVHSPVNEELP